MRKRVTGRPDPYKEHVCYYLKVVEWHASFHGPTWSRQDIPQTDWRGEKWIEHRDKLEHAASLNLKLIVAPYRQTMVVNKRDFDRFEFEMHSTHNPGGGLFQICPDKELRGWLFLPLSGVLALIPLLASGRDVVLEIYGSAFKRGTALVHANSSWSTEGHPDLEAEFA